MDIQGFEYFGEIEGMEENQQWVEHIQSVVDFLEQCDNLKVKEVKALEAMKKYLKDKG